MTDEIIKLYENAGINPERQDCCKIADKYWASNTESGFEYLMQKECPYNQECTDECEYAYDKVVYPPFTAKKQIAILQLLTQQCDLTISHFREWEFIHYDGQEPLKITGKDFTETFAKLINAYWHSLTEEEKQQVKGILE